MPDFADFEKKLRGDPRAEKLMKEAMSSGAGRKVAQSIDGGRVEKALREGNSAELQDILRQVLSTAEGRGLAEKVKKAFSED